MKRQSIFAWVLPAMLGLAGSLATTTAHAQENCLELPNVVIGAGGSASVPLLARVSAALSTASPPLTVVYQSPGACYGITPYVDDTRISGTASYWVPPPAGSPANTPPVQRSCNLPLTGAVPDFGMLGTSATLCEGVETVPAGIGDFAGPVTSWSLIVPQTSSQQVISAEAAYFIYGFGPVEGQASPWTNPAHLWGRNATSAALIAISLAIDVPAERMGSWFAGDRAAWDVRTNQAMIQRVTESGQVAPEATLGFVSTEVAEDAPTQVRTLAYQHFGQTCGYLPNSSATRLDKANVRDGHYFLWSAYHFYAPIDEAGQIIDPETRRFIGYFTGAEAPPAELPLLQIIADNGNVPECAMNVWRDEDLGPLYSYQPETPCSCAYEFFATGTAPASCQDCDEPTDCPSSAPVCRYGYCEVQ